MGRAGVRSLMKNREKGNSWTPADPALIRFQRWRGRQLGLGRGREGMGREGRRVRQGSPTSLKTHSLHGISPWYLDPDANAGMQCLGKWLP